MFRSGKKPALYPMPDAVMENPGSLKATAKVIALIVLTVAVFVADRYLPRIVATGVAYVPILLLVVWLLPPSRVWVWCGALSLLIVLGFVISPLTGPIWLEYANPALSIFALSTTAYLGVRGKQTSEKWLRTERALHLAREKAMQAERLAAVGQVIATLSHECRNSLQRIQTALDLLGFEIEGQEGAERCAHGIRVAQEELLQLFDDVRNYTAPIKLDRSPCDAAEIWRGAWNSLDGTRNGRLVQLHEEITTEDLKCDVDARRMTQVFRNLFENSLAACSDPVEINVRCRGASLDGRPALRIDVHDNGPGLSTEQQHRVFDAFYTTKANGAGLGMAIVRRIVEAHGGTIAVENGRAPGAEFSVLIPRGPS